MKTARRILICTGSDNFIGRETAQGALQYCHEHGRWDIIYLGSVDAAAVVKSLRAHRPEAVLLAVTDAAIVGKVGRLGAKLVNVSSCLELDVPTVCVNGRAVGAMGAAYFLQRGFRHLAFSGHRLGWQDRAEGFRAEARDHDVACHVHLDTGDFTVASLAEWLIGLPKPVGVLGSGDLKAQQVVVACQHAGLRMPEQVAVLGAGNDFIQCWLTQPEISSIMLPGKAIGYRAMGLLAKLLGGGRPPARRILLQPLGIASRKSSDTIAVQDPDVRRATEFIRANADRRIGVKDVLEAVCLSRRSLELRFEKALGWSPGAEIARARLEHAKRLLTDTDMKLSSVAERSGFSSYAIFYRSFLRQMGMLPSQYRRRLGTT